MTPARSPGTTGTGLWVIARTARRRPTLQHRVSEVNPAFTRCKLRLADWPWRTYQRQPIAYLTCLKCHPEGM